MTPLFRHLAASSLAALLLALPDLSQAAVLRVGTGCAFATPQSAFAAAAHGDIVRIRSGNYLGIDNAQGPFVINHGVRVEGGYDDCTTTARTGRSEFYGMGTSSTSLVTVNALPAVHKVVFERITLRDNQKSSGNGAGLHVSNARVEFDDVIVRNNRALDGYGGGVFLSQATLALALDGTAQITGNQANGGGGISADGSGARILFDVGAEGAAATITDNRTNTTGQSGSAVYLNSGADAVFVDTVVGLTASAAFSGARSAMEADGFGATSIVSLVRCQLIDSSVSNKYSGFFGQAGGQLSLRDTLVQGWNTGVVMRDGPVMVEGGRFEANINETGWGGAMRLLGSASLDVRGTTFINNVAKRAGGAIALFESATWAIAGMPAPGTATRFESNTAQEEGGGAIYSDSDGVGSINADPVFHGDVEFINNLSWPEAAGGGWNGGAIYFGASANATTTLRSPLRFEGNTAIRHGGAISIEHGTLNIDARPGQEVVFVANGSQQGDGGAIHRGDNAQVSVNFSAGNHGSVRFSNNSAGAGYGGSIAALGSGSLRLQAPMLFEHSDGTSSANYGGHIAVVANPPAAGEFLAQGWDGGGRGIKVKGGYSEFDGGGLYLSGGGVSATLDWVQVGDAGAPNRTFSGEGANIAVVDHADLALRNVGLGHADIQPVSPTKGSALFADGGATVSMTSIFGTAGTPPAPGNAWPCEAATLAFNRHCSEIHDNRSNATSGGAVYAGNGAQVTLRGVSMERNLGNPGAIQVAASATITATDVRILGHANAIRVQGGGEFFGDHLTLADNNGVALDVVGGAGTAVTLTRSIVWNNQTSIVLGGTANASFGCNISQEGIYGNATNPRFVVGDRGSHRLGVGSPALDQCADAPGHLHDLDGAPRQQGAASDMGAYEGSTQQESLFASGFE